MQSAADSLPLASMRAFEVTVVPSDLVRHERVVRVLAETLADFLENLKQHLGLEEAAAITVRAPRAAAARSEQRTRRHWELLAPLAWAHRDACAHGRRCSPSTPTSKNTCSQVVFTKCHGVLASTSRYVVCVVRERIVRVLVGRHIARPHPPRLPRGHHRGCLHSSFTHAILPLSEMCLLAARAGTGRDNPRGLTRRTSRRVRDFLHVPHEHDRRCLCLG